MSAPTKRQLAARHIRRLRTMRESLLTMAKDWDDVDQFCVNELTTLADAVEQVAITLTDDSSGGNP